ncbi:MAG: hypothetical protein KA527_10775 [Cytophagaceae bacterium]|nr:hypothetical protein [Cytophagaceae bacterium]
MKNIKLVLKSTLLPIENRTFAPSSVNHNMKFLSTVCLLLFIQFTSLAETATDSTKKEIQFATTALITNNGISVVPIFTLGKPATIINFTVGRKFTFEPEFRVSLEGKPWSFIYWFRYKLAKTSKFTWSIGAHPAIIFKTIPVTINGNNEQVLRAQRFVAAEMAQNYRFNKHVNLGFYYLVGAGSVENKTKPTNLLTLRGGYNNVDLGKGFIAGVNSQLIYLFTNGEEGSYVNASVTLTHKQSPVTLSYFYNKPINTSITGGKDPVWNVAATYAFNKMFSMK